MDKAQELPERRGPLPALPCKSCRKALRNHPLPQGSPRGWCHLPLPASPSPPEPTPAAAGRAEGKGQGEGSTRMLWSTLDQRCPIPREGLPQGDAAVPDFWGDQELGAGILHGQQLHGQPAPGSNPTILPAPSQAEGFCRGKGKAQKYPGMCQKDPCSSPHLRVRPAPGSSSCLLPHSQSTRSFAWVICVKNKLS